MQNEDSLFREKERDNFSSETPRRGFVEWNEEGNYAIGKGFKPSTQHLPVYLNALLVKEHWRTVQILGDSARPLTILFEKVIHHA